MRDRQTSFLTLFDLPKQPIYTATLPSPLAYESIASQGSSCLCLSSIFVGETFTCSSPATGRHLPTTPLPPLTDYTRLARHLATPGAVCSSPASGAHASVFTSHRFILIARLSDANSLLDSSARRPSSLTRPQLYCRPRSWRASKRTRPTPPRPKLSRRLARCPSLVVPMI